MTATIGKVAYVATWDATSLSKGILSAQAMFRQQKKITESLMTPTERYSTAVTNLENIIAKYPDVAKHKVRLMRDLQKEYIREEHAAKKSAKGVMDADQRRQQQEAASVKAHRAALQQRLADRQRYNDQMRQKIADSMKYWQQENAGFHASGGSGTAPARGGGVLGAAAALARNPIGVAGVAGAGAAAGVAGMNRLEQGNAANSFRSFESNEAYFKTILGSSERAAQMMRELDQASQETRKSILGFADGAKTLLRFQVSADQVVPVLKSMSIITGGNKDQMDRLSRAMGQVNGYGRLMAEELGQMVDAGWNPAWEIMRKYNIDMAEFRRRMEAGAISANMVTEALIGTTQAGGQLADQLKNAAGTSKESFEEMQASWERMNIKMGEALKPVTSAWTNFKAEVFADIGEIAEAMSSTTPDAVADPAAEKAARQAEARAARAAKVEAERARVQAALAEQEKRRQAEKEMGLQSIAGLQMDILRQSCAVDADSLGKFDRYVSLMDEENQKKAVLDFSMFKNLDSIIGMLDEEVQAELRKTEEMEKQAKLQGELVRKREEFGKMGDEVVKQFEREMQAAAGVNVELVDQLAKFEALYQAGKIDQEQFAFARDRAVKENTRSGFEGASATTSNITAGSQEAYQFLVGIQDRNFKAQQAKLAQQIELQRATNAALEKANQLLDEIAENPVGVAG